MHLLWFLASHLRELVCNESSAVQSNRFAKLIDVSKTEFFTKLIDMRKTELALVKKPTCGINDVVKDGEK